MSILSVEINNMMNKSIIQRQQVTFNTENHDCFIFFGFDIEKLLEIFYDNP